MSHRGRHAPPPPPRKTQAQLQAEQRSRRKNSYHLVASKNRLLADPEEEEDDLLFNYLTKTRVVQNNPQRDQQIRLAKTAVLRCLAQSAGDTSTPEFQSALTNLTQLFDPQSAFDARKLPPRPHHNRSSRGSLFRAEEKRSSTSSSPPPSVEGMWISLQKPRFQDCLGVNDGGEFEYTLGRMSFGMFQPRDLVCSIQGAFNPVHVVDGRETQSIREKVPKSLISQVGREGGAVVLRSYDVVTAFTIEVANDNDPDKFGPTSPNRQVDRPVEALLTTRGFALPDPDIPNRLTIWFTEGSIEVDSDEQRWKRIFASAINQEHTKSHMEPDGRMSYKLTRPIGGQDKSYIDVVYLDESMRIMRSNHGDVYVFARVPYFPDE